jgi:glutamate synthase (NADPH) small chain
MMKEHRIPIFDFLTLPRIEPSKLSPEQRIQHFASIYIQYNQQQAKAQSNRCLDCGNPYCEWKCPVHNHIPQWLHLVAEGKILEACELCHQTNTLPEVCGRICPQEKLCEGACTLNDGLGAITIGAIEQYITDSALKLGWKPDLSGVRKTTKKASIIGAGPAGLACADILIRSGVRVDVYDRYPEIGGLLTFGIPEFKLEKQIIKKRRQLFEDMGINFHLNVDVGKTITIKELYGECDALFLGLGADKAKGVSIKGSQLVGIYHAMPFLLSIIYKHLGLPTNDIYSLKAKRVIILGGGDTAMDCNRTAIRQSAKYVTCVYRRMLKDMPGSTKEVKHAIEEGVEFIWNRQAIEFIGDKKLRAIKFASTSVGTNGKLIIDENSTEVLPADFAIMAYGFSANPPNWLSLLDVLTKTNGLVLTNQKNMLPLQTSNPKVFAGGDMVIGADLVVNAIAQGRKAAQSILDYLAINT